MKRALLLPLLCILFRAEAQTAKGTFLLGGSAAFTSVQNRGKIGGQVFDEVKVAHYSLAPEAAYFVLNRFAAGIWGNYSRYKETAETGTPGNTSEQILIRQQFTVGPMVRYYYPVGSKVALLAHAAVGLGTATSKLTNPGSVHREPEARLATTVFGPGVACFLTPHVALETTLYYRTDHERYRLEGTGEKVEHRSSGIWLGLGFKVLLAGNSATK